MENELATHHGIFHISFDINHLPIGSETLITELNIVLAIASEAKARGVSLPSERAAVSAFS